MSKPTTSYANHFSSNFSSLKLLMVSVACLFGLLAIILLFSPARPAHAFPDEFHSNLTQSSIPARQASLSVEILSSPTAPIAVNKEEDGPRLFVVQARVTNNGNAAATNLTVTLSDYTDEAGWVLASGEDPERFLGSLGAGETYNAYWLASYPITAGADNDYTVTATADGIGAAADTATATVDEFNRTGNTNFTTANLNVKVGFEFTIDTTFSLGSNPDNIILGPVGNLDFDAGAYRLVKTKAEFYKNNSLVQTIEDDMYISGQLTDPDSDRVDVAYTFLALDASNTSICPYTAVGGKFDNDYCSTNNDEFPVFGELTVTMSKTSSAQQGKIEQGDVMTYTINYENTFTQVVEGIWIWDEPPANVTVDESSFTMTPDPAESTADRYVWNIGTLGAESSGQIKFRVTANGTGSTLPDGTSLVNNADLSINPDRFTAQSILNVPVTTTIKAPNIALSKTDNKTTANPGDVFNYVISLDNVGGAAAQNLRITDTLPITSLVVLAGDTTPSFSSRDGRTLVWDTATLANVTEIIIPVALKANIPSTQNFTNNVEATYENSFGFKTTKTDQDTTQAQEGDADIATLEVVKTATPENEGTLNVGDLVTYTVTITNKGPVAQANAVTVIDDLPTGVICQSVSATKDAPAGCNDPLFWSISTLAVNESASLEIVVLLGAETEGQSIINTIEVDGPNVDPIDPGDIEVCPNGQLPEGDTCTVKPGPPGQTVVTVSKSAKDMNEAPLEVGDTISYTIEVKNEGPEIAFGLVVTDTLSPFVICQSVSTDPAVTPPLTCANPVVWEIESLNPDETATMTIVVLLGPNSAGEDIVNKVELNGENLDGGSVTADDVCPDGSDTGGGGTTCGTDPVTGSANVVVTKTSEDVNGGQLEIGDTLQYTIRAENQGDEAAFNIQITDDLPNLVTCQTLEATKDQPEGCDDPLVWTISQLVASEVATLTIDVTIDNNAVGQSIVNSLSVDGTNVDSDTDVSPVCPDGSTSTPCDGPVQPVDISKTAVDVNGAPLEVGDTIRYTLQVANNSSVAVSNIVVTDDLPDQVTCVPPVTGDNAPSDCADPLVWTIPSLAAGTTAKLIVNVTINNDAGGESIINSLSGTVDDIPVDEDDLPDGVCPDGSQPTGGACSTSGTPEGPPIIYLPIVFKN